MKQNFKSKYIPKNPQKYIGNYNNIICRSRWEVNVCRFFDLSTSVVRWASEEIKIPYVSPLDGRIHHYFPDFYCEYLDATGNPIKEIVEVKPLSQSHEDAAKSDYDKKALLINKAKWAAATQFANSRGLKFRVITEMSIFKQSAKTSTRKTKINKTTVSAKKTTTTKRSTGTTTKRSVKKK